MITSWEYLGIDAVDSLNDGANELKDGTGKLSDATGSLVENTGKLHGAVGELLDGTTELKNGLSEIAKNNQTLLNGGRSAFEGVCMAVGKTLNEKLEAKGMEPVTLTPDNYTEVISGLLKQLDADTIYQQAYEMARTKVTSEVEAKAEELYYGYIDSIADTVYRQYMKSQEDTLYAQVAAQAVLEQLMEKGETQDAVAAFLQTEDGKALISQTLTAMTEEQKEQIIAAAVGEANKAAEGIAEAKGQLDNFSLFYIGLKEYTSAVSEAVAGADTLEKGDSFLI